MSILRIRDKNGNIQEIPVIKGNKGDKGDKGDKGEAGSALEPLIITGGEFSSSEAATTFVPSHSSSEIYEYVQKGGSVFFQPNLEGEALYALSYAHPEGAFFLHITDDNFTYMYEVFRDTGYYYEHQNVDADGVYNIVNSTMKPIIVKLTYNDDGTLTANKGSAEIYEYVNQGKEVYLSVDSELYRITTATTNLSTCICITDEGFVKAYCIFRDKSGWYYEMDKSLESIDGLSNRVVSLESMAPTATIKDGILVVTYGNLEEVMDDIIEQQNELIGGDGV
jgi:hypothetical protein